MNLPDIITQGRGVVRGPRHGQVGRHAHRLRVGPRGEAGRLRAADGHPVRATLIYDVCGGIPNGRTLKGLIPGGSSMPPLDASEIDVA